MTTVKLKIQINNSYESEPSSGSGSSISEGNESESSVYKGSVSDLHHMFHPCLDSTGRIQFFPAEENYPQCTNRCKGLIHSSDESDFEGFTDSQIERPNSTLKNRMCSNINNVSELFKEDYTVSKTKPPCSSLYDIFIEQESCNAVDISLSHNKRVELSDFMSNISFNGKISSLNCADQLPKCSTNLNVKIVDYKYANEKSPDLFEDYDGSYGGRNKANSPKEDLKEKKRERAYFLADTNSPEENNENVNHKDGITLKQSIKRERELLNRIKNCLAGIPPPPSLTIPQMDVFAAVIGNKDEILRFKDDVNATKCANIHYNGTSFFKPSHAIDELKAMSWRDSLCVRQHGLYYNICRESESVELLSLAIIERFIGAETSTSYSSFTSSPSSAKKRSLRQKMLTKSPGNRLSHLAKRRAIFSSANLATSQKSNCSLDGMQILMDKKLIKSRRRGLTPRRMTPNAKNWGVRKTPSSSVRKRLSFQPDVVRVIPSRESSKRALFQSPAKHKKMPVAPVSKPTFKTDIANRVEKSKRALFSPIKKLNASVTSLSCSSSSEFVNLSQTSQSSLFGGDFDSLISKRKRTDDVPSDINENQRKKYRYEAETLTPRSLKIKSQSFCIGTQSISNNSGVNDFLGNSSITSNLSMNSHLSDTRRSISRTSSDMVFSASGHLTENHRKKLLWAVSQALQAKQVGVTHADFKKWASVLAKVVRRIFQEFYQKSNCSTSEIMLRLSKKYVYSVISGKNADEIYLSAKSKIEDEKRLSSTRLSGYIARDEYESRKTIQKKLNPCTLENQQAKLFRDPQMCSKQTTTDSKSTENSILVEQNKNNALKLSIQPNANLQNSSSKCNLGGTALRENFDSEQRKSAQKNFTGKDQRNVSPYVNVRTSKITTAFGSSLCNLNQCTIRAKRQISFDS